jgi:hypothetical protein
VRRTRDFTEIIIERGCTFDCNTYHRKYDKSFGSSERQVVSYFKGCNIDLCNSGQQQNWYFKSSLIISLIIFKLIY